MKIKNLFSDKGLLYTLLISSIVLFIFYGEVLLNANHRYFAGNGDGMQSYYNTLYHIKFDKSYLHSDGLNYPYGENVYYTGNHPLISNSIKFISKFVDISDYTIGFLNVWMLSSIIFGSLFIYLIFKELKLPEIYSAFASVGIAFLSPQLDRFGGHFSLTYVFAIPLMLYLLMLFYRKPRLWLSIIIGIVTFWALNTHVYLFGFYGILFLFYWPFILISRKEFRVPQYYLLHLLIQFILPMIIVQLILFFSDNVIDRTGTPWGFLECTATPESIFLPLGKPYGQFLYKFSNFNYIHWEGTAFVGIISTFCFAFILFKIFQKLFTKRFKTTLAISDNNLLNLFFWCSIAALLYSFGIPFILKLESLLKYIGPLKQMRGVGRFAWIFFYVMNITAFYLLWKWIDARKNKYIKYCVPIIILLVFYYDAYLNVRGKGTSINNKVELLDDRDNQMWDNNWVNQINIKKYQAILPLPYFNIGSENYWYNDRCNIMFYTFLSSLKTGLPTTGVLLSRTSISQTFNNIQLFLDPYRRPKILKDFPNKKPFLVITPNCEEMYPNEKQLLSKAIFLTKNQLFSVYELPYQVLEHLTDSLYIIAHNNFTQNKLSIINGFSCTDNHANFIYNGFDDTPTTYKYRNSGAYQKSITDYNTIFEGSLPCFKDTTDYIASFWFGNILKDLYPRTKMEIDFIDNYGTVYKSDYPDVWRLFVAIDNDWALCEYKFRLNAPTDKIKITLWNHELFKKDILTIDELLIRPIDNNIYKINSSGIFQNNRDYLK